MMRDVSDPRWSGWRQLTSSLNDYHEQQITYGTLLLNGYCVGPLVAYSRAGKRVVKSNTGCKRSGVKGRTHSQSAQALRPLESTTGLVRKWSDVNKAMTPPALFSLFVAKI